MIYEANRKKNVESKKDQKMWNKDKTYFLKGVLGWSIEMRME